MTHVLTIRDVVREFYGARVLRGVTFCVEAGAITGLIGPNGAGKTTLFNVVSGLFPPTSGSIAFIGDECAGVRPDRLVRRGLVRTFQLARGFPKLSVFQHLMLYGPAQPGEGLVAALLGTKENREREAELAERAWSIAGRLKLRHVIDNPVTALSGGQKKLVEIGRSLMAEPKLILLDEPMAGVNPSLAEEISDHLRVLNAEGISICLIEHDMALIRKLCKNVIVMAEGQTLMQGSFDAVSEDPRVQEAYLGRRQ
ncbi:ABC transporter ATP-binding protein [Bosea sp. AK1]|uniref:ABC transporter ATP-binding protein n=1 Tax=Bosea sp. AK1 TaxID=2587160 RepID=UPI001152A81F|nr:ABC transporter ATP-binding protein [Bosea sp. AK1]